MSKVTTEDDEKALKLKKILDASFSYQITESNKKIRAAMLHEMTCGNLAHGHGVVRVRWNPPASKEYGETSGLE